MEISNVARWIWVDSAKEYYDYSKDFPTLISPWPYAWLEYVSPGFMNIKGELKELPKVKVGVSVQRSPADLGTALALLAEMKRSNPNVNEEAFSKSVASWIDAKWLQIFTTYAKVYNANKPHKMMQILISGVDASGKFVGKPVHLMGDANTTEEDVEKSSTLLIPVLMALSLCHCKNVEIIEQHPDAKINKKRARRGKEPKITYKTLVIDGAKKLLREEGGSETNGLAKALHICRGHFATYSEDKPLFGKHTGTFWKPMHTRGSAKHGVAAKDYRINP